MTLTLTMVRCPERVAPETRHIEGGEFSIGRAPGNDWVLPDPDRDLSKQHCLLAYRSGAWQIVDLSMNGTFLNRDNQPIGQDQSRPLNDGDRLSLGPYDIEVRIAEAPSYAARSQENPFSGDPFASPAGFSRETTFAQRPAEPQPFWQEGAPASINLPSDYDPLAPDAEAPMAAPTAADHSPHLEDFMRPPRVVLPEDWDREFPQAAATPPPALATVPTPPPPLEFKAAPAPAPTQGPTAPPTGDLLAAFLRGAGLEDFRPGDPEAAMERWGATFRAFAAGLRQTLVARAAIKREFRIEQTVIQRAGNNPLKFSTDDDDALIALVGDNVRGSLSAAEALSEALRDIRMHELATISAMQSAAKALLAEFDPAKLRRGVEHGGLDLIPSQKKARAWDQFESLHAKTTEAMSDSFDSVFGKTFARAYERALTEVTESDKRR